MYLKYSYQLALHISALQERRLQGVQNDPAEIVCVLRHKCRICECREWIPCGTVSRNFRNLRLTAPDGIHSLPSHIRHLWRSIHTISAASLWVPWIWRSWGAETCRSELIFKYMVYFGNVFRWFFFYHNLKMHGPSCKIVMTRNMVMSVAGHSDRKSVEYMSGKYNWRWILSVLSKRRAQSMFCSALCNEPDCHTFDFLASGILNRSNNVQYRNIFNLPRW
jgi:hypothetical protein